MKEMPGFLSPRRGLPLLLIPEYSGINKEQRVHDRSKTAHRKAPVKCLLTIFKHCLTILVILKQIRTNKLSPCFSCGSAGKESACNAGDLGSTPVLGRSPGERKGYPLQYSGLENYMDYSPWGLKESDMAW